MLVGLCYNTSMLVVRLKPVGRSGQITYRVVVAEKRSKLDGKVVDDLGFYNAVAKPSVVEIDKKRLEHWTSQGAIVSPAIKKLLVAQQ